MEKNKNNFQLYGDKGLNIYYKWLSDVTKNNTEYSYELLASMDEYATYDIMQIRHSTSDYTDTTTSYIEIKTRDVPLYMYDDCVIDAYKIHNLQKLSYLSGNRAFLAAIYTNENKIALWEIEKDREYTTITKEVNWHTAAIEDGKKIKEMVSLPIKEAKIYNYQ